MTWSLELNPGSSENKDNNRILFIRLLAVLNEIINIKCIAQHLAYRMYSINISVIVLARDG